MKGIKRWSVQETSGGLRALRHGNATYIQRGPPHCNLGGANVKELDRLRRTAWQMTTLVILQVCAGEVRLALRNGE